MQRTDLGLSIGAGTDYTKFTLAYNDVTSACTATTGPIQIKLLANPGGNAVNPLPFQISQAGKMLGVMIHPTAGFTGSNMSSITVGVGISGGTGVEFAAAYQMFSALITVGSTTIQESGPEFKSGSVLPQTVVTTWQLTNGNLNALTAGSVDIYLYYLSCSTQSA